MFIDITIQVQLETILKELVQTADFTSAWLCKFDFERKMSIVHAGYAMNHENLLESESDVGEEYPEGNPEFIAWLLDHNTQHPTIHIDEMDRNDPEFLEYVEGGADSVSFVHVIIDGRTWGFIEFWESRQKREFSPEDFVIAQDFASRLATTLQKISIKA